jgi:uncharacterized membrane protein YkoI
MTPPPKSLLPLVAALLLGVGGAMTARAGDAQDHDRARQALESGEILPLPAILERVERSSPGQIMEVELDREGERWVYEIKVLRKGGSLVKLKLDARNGTLLESSKQGGKGQHRSGEHP